YGSRTDRADEPLNRCPQRPLLGRGHAVPDADRISAVLRIRADGMGALPYCQETNGARRAVAEYPAPGLSHHHEAARQDGRGALPDLGRRKKKKIIRGSCSI